MDNKQYYFIISIIFMNSLTQPIITFNPVSAEERASSYEYYATEFYYAYVPHFDYDDEKGILEENNHSLVIESVVDEDVEEDEPKVLGKARAPNYPSESNGLSGSTESNASLPTVEEQKQFISLGLSFLFLLIVVTIRKNATSSLRLLIEQSSSLEILCNVFHFLAASNSSISSKRRLSFDFSNALIHTSYNFSILKLLFSIIKYIRKRFYY